MPVSDRDKRYFERIGAYKAESHADVSAAHRSLPVSERLRRSWELYVAHRGEVDLSAREDDPTPFYERARTLGLIASRSKDRIDLEGLVRLPDLDWAYVEQHCRVGCARSVPRPAHRITLAAAPDLDAPLVMPRAR
jgi:hypothetical protein